MTPAVRHEIVGPLDSTQGLRIAHLSDFHLWFGGRKLRMIESLLETWKPDVLALTGDYADTYIGRRLALDWIRRMAACYPLCWIAGNHDRWWGKSFCRELEALAHAHPVDLRDALIAGKTGDRYRFTAWPRIEDHGSRESNPESVIVLLHNPAVIDRAKIPEDRGCLLLAGHLHGGQINLWRDRDGRPQPAASCYEWLVERAQIGRASLIVSRGLGDTLPIRMGAPQEVVMIDWRER